MSKSGHILVVDLVKASEDRVSALKRAAFVVKYQTGQSGRPSERSPRAPLIGQLARPLRLRRQEVDHQP